MKPKSWAAQYTMRSLLNPIRSRKRVCYSRLAIYQIIYKWRIHRRGLVIIWSFCSHAFVLTQWLLYMRNPALRTQITFTACTPRSFRRSLLPCKCSKSFRCLAGILIVVLGCRTSIRFSILRLFAVAHVFRGELPQRPTSTERGKRWISINMCVMKLWNSFRFLRTNDFSG